MLNAFDATQKKISLEEIKIKISPSQIFKKRVMKHVVVVTP